ncbi:MAG: outer membrane beta-barrel domain-containing protein [Pseudomonadota bacterium]
MEDRLRVLFLIGLAVGASGCSWMPFVGGGQPAPAGEPVDGDDRPVQVIEPEVERRDIKTARIDTEDFEVGIYGGIMSVEDFGSNPSYGARLAYHVNELLFVEAAVGRTDTEETSFERLSGAAELLTDEEREFIYYNMSLGLNIFPGEAFLGANRAYTQSLYVIGGLGSTRFADDDRFTINLGFGYRFLVTDSIALHVDFRDHLFDIDILGEEKTVNNLEGHLGFTVFF